MEYRIQGKTLKDIADSIRSVDPNIQALSPQEMDDEIRRLTAVVDQTYDGESSNPISGKAVKQAIDTLSEKPDYNQNDSTAKDYIKNRPCYTEEVETTLTLLDGTFDFEEAQPGLYGYFQESSFTFEEGKTYTVVFDGTSYNCTCYIINGAIAVLGNSSLFGVPGGNNEPFLMMTVDGQLQIDTNLTDASHTINITTEKTTTNIKQLDEKYIPDGVKSVQSDYEQNDSSAKDYIRNRPCYTRIFEGETKTHTLLPDGTFDFEEDLDFDDYFSIQSNIPADFKEGQLYTVVFDGTSYDCTGYIPADGCLVIIGNASLFDPSLTGGNNEPFVMVVYDAGSGCELEIRTNLTDASHTIEITMEEVIPPSEEIYHNTRVSFSWNVLETTGFTDVSDGGIGCKFDSSSGISLIEGFKYKFSCGYPNNPYERSQEMLCYRYSENILCLSSEGSFIDIKNGKVGLGEEGVVIIFYEDTNETIIITRYVSQSAIISIIIERTPNYIHTLDKTFIPSDIYPRIESVKVETGKKMDNYNPKGTGAFSLNRKAKTTVGEKSFAEGYTTTASGRDSHAEGYKTTASGDDSHAEGNQTIASGLYSHAEGMFTKASGGNSHAEGYYTEAATYQHVQGKYNVKDSSQVYADIIGNGTTESKRSNAATVDWSGNAWYAGDVYVGSTSGKNKDEGSKKLATEEYVDSKQSDASLGLTGATVGQIAKITAVDSDGKPTAYEPVDLPIENALRLVVDTTTTEDVAQIEFTEDIDGNPLKLKKFIFNLEVPAATAANGNATFGVSDYRWIGGVDTPKYSYYGAKTVPMSTSKTIWWGEICMNIENDGLFAIMYKRVNNAPYSNNTVNSDGGTYHRLDVRYAPYSSGSGTYYFHEAIDRIFYKSGSDTVLIPTGTIIRIWGVDA